MARNASGTYTLPAGNPVVTGTTIESSWANATMQDIATEMTDSLNRSGKGAMLDQLKLTDGSAGAPGLTFNLDQDTGLYRSGTNAMVAVAGAQPSVTFEANKASVEGGSGAAALVVRSGNSTADEGVVELEVDSDVFALRVVDDDGTDGQSLLEVDLADDQSLFHHRPLVPNSEATSRLTLLGQGLSLAFTTRASTFTAVYADRGVINNCTGIGQTVNLDPAATLGNGWWTIVRATAFAVTINPDGSETIDGSATISVAAGTSVAVYCTGTAFITGVGLGTGSIPSGTRMIFHQNAAPTGWTKSTEGDVENKAIRTTTGTTSDYVAGDDFTDVFGVSKTTAGHTLTGDESGIQSHGIRVRRASAGPVPESLNDGDAIIGDDPSGSTDSVLTTTFFVAGADAIDAHTHGLTMDLNYLDCIVGVKN